MLISKNFLRLSLSAIFILSLISCGGGGGGSSSNNTGNDVSNDPSDNIGNDPGNDNPELQITPLFGLNFGPHTRDGQNPDRGTFIGEDQIREHLEVLDGYTNCIRTFGMSGGLDVVPRVAQEMGFCVAAGAWLDKNKATNDIELAKLIEIGLAGQATYLIVGSEALLRGDLSVDELVGYIEQVRVAVPGVPVTTGEIYSNWIDSPTLIDAVDLLFVNYYAYWEGLSVDVAIKAIHMYHQDVVIRANGKEVIVSETGWPTAGDTIGNAVPSPENSAFHLKNFVSWAEANGVNYFYFEAFDELWKRINEGEQGANWGLWDKIFALKPGMLSVFEGSRIEDNWSGGEETPGGFGNPSIAYTSVPPLGSFGNLAGQILHVLPSDYAVVNYIQVSGRWWIKPFANRPLVSIAFDGSFIVDITTGGIDQNARTIQSFLVRRDYVPPIVLGGRSLPAELWENALADVSVSR